MESRKGWAEGGWIRIRMRIKKSGIRKAEGGGLRAEGGRIRIRMRTILGDRR